MTRILRLILPLLVTLTLSSRPEAAQNAAVAERPAVPSVVNPRATVPFVGCPADGQQGPVTAPKVKSKRLAIPQRAAILLAWYQTAEDGCNLGVFAPRGWHCFGTYGSNGESLYISPDLISTKDFFGKNPWKGITGTGIQLTVSYGGTSGRFDVAEIAARVFPHFRWFVKKVIAEDIEPASDFHLGPFPADKLTYKSDHLVEFITPANSTGLGTQSWLAKGPGNITGFAWIGGEDTDLLQLNMRLPPNLSALGPIIMAEAEREASQ